MALNKIIIGFFCNWCAYRALDQAGVLRLRQEANLRVIRVMCSGRVEPQFVLKAFQEGAAGVMIGGCKPGGCHYTKGNLSAASRFRLLCKMLPQFGVNDKQLKFVWTAAGEAQPLLEEINSFQLQLNDFMPEKRDSRLKLSIENMSEL